ncbi:MAG TPA: metallopeptidase family protein [Candidatus Paceibacterota bacterium]
MSAEEFERIVHEELELVPEKWNDRLGNVAFLVEDEPDPEDRGDDVAGTLLGLYKGVPATERGDMYGLGMTLPDTITLYRLPILQAAEEDGIEPRIVIRETLWHEIAHHFGFEEEDVGRREDDGTNQYR